MDEKPSEDNSLCQWAAFYSIVINADCFQKIRKQAAVLKRVSTSLSLWNNSKYGQVLPIIEAVTLAKIHRFWVNYSAFADLPAGELERTRDRFMREFQEIRSSLAGNCLSGLRAVGATFLKAVPIMMEVFNKFWATGVVGGLKELVKDSDYINPLFVYSTIGGDRCIIHYGTDPIMGFHCDTALAEVYPGTWPSFDQYDDNMPLGKMVSRIAHTAILEFKSWCASFHFASQDPSLLQIYHFCGDALEFCYSLQSASGIIDKSENIFETCAPPWHVPIEFNGGVYGPFDVVDTSNIADHVGLLNILTCALPLLKQSASATLYTDNLAYLSAECSSIARLKHLLSSDPVSIFTLLGAAPMEYLTGLTTKCSFHEEANFHLAMAADTKPLRTQLRWQFSWKHIVFGDEHATSVCKARFVPSWDVDTLARTVVSIYIEMFPHEDLTRLFQTLGNAGIVAKPSFYTKASFVSFLKLVQRRNDAIWPLFFDHLIYLISSDSPLSFSAQTAQELFLQLHLQRVYTMGPLQEFMLRPDSVQIPSAWPDVFYNSEVLPYGIPFLFRIPRERCSLILNQLNPREAAIVDTIFEVHIETPSFHNKYSVVHVACANWRDQRPDSSLLSSLREGQDLIIHFYVPTRTVLRGNRNAPQISLRLQINIGTFQQFRGVLGPEMIIFQTSMWNDVYVTQQVTHVSLPVNSTAIVGLMGTEIRGKDFHASAPKISSNKGALEATIRIEVSGNQKVRLSMGDKVESSQASPCSFAVILGRSRMEVVFPFPFQHTQSRLRVARKSGWIEVIAPFKESASESAFNLEPLPVLKEEARYFSWNLSRLSSDMLPQLKLSTKCGLEWINSNVSSSFSQREKLLREKHIKDLTCGDVRVDFKDTLHSLFTKSAGVARTRTPTSTVQPNCHHRVFFLNLEEGGVMTIIFVTGVRLEPSDSTIVLDAAVLPLVPQIVHMFEKELDVIRSHGQILQCTMESYQFWTVYIKASVQRSRSWSHRSGCSGKLKDGVVDHLQQFLCRCGAGKVPREFQDVYEWRSFTPFVTRCLLTPLFPIQYVEAIIAIDFGKQVASAMTSHHGSKAEEPGTVCATCKVKEGPNAAKLLRCMGCGKATYCSKECQKKDWKSHKSLCRSSS